MFSYCLRTVNETFNFRQTERSFFLAWVDGVCQFHSNCKWLSSCCVGYWNVSDYVYSVRRRLIEFSLSSRILLYIDLLSTLQGTIINIVTFFFFTKMRMWLRVNKSRIIFKPWLVVFFIDVYWYLFKMYAYCSLGSSLRSFLVINIVRKGFGVPFWNCFGAKPAVLRIRFKICMCKQHEQ